MGWKGARWFVTLASGRRAFVVDRPDIVCAVAETPATPLPTRGGRRARRATNGTSTIALRLSISSSWMPPRENSRPPNVGLTALIAWKPPFRYRPVSPCLAPGYPKSGADPSQVCAPQWPRASDGCLPRGYCEIQRHGVGPRHSCIVPNARRHQSDVARIWRARCGGRRTVGLHGDDAIGP
jgi:hypothetical protein